MLRGDGAQLLQKAQRGAKPLEKPLAHQRSLRMFNNLPGTGFFVVFGVICAVIGWAVIESILWLLSFIHITIG